ncbi:MAG: tetratricopeptide repeat protein, partial [Armatimonadia bacterium]
MHRTILLRMLPGMLVMTVAPVLAQTPQGAAELGQQAYAAGNMTLALEQFLAALKERPNHPMLLCWTGSAYLQLGQLADAEKYLKQSIGADPRYPVAHNNLGNVYLAMGRFDAAEAAYKQSVALDDQYFDGHYNLANLYLRQNKDEKAWNEYTRALK